VGPREANVAHDNSLAKCIGSFMSTKEYIGTHDILIFAVDFHHRTWGGQKQGCCCLVQTVVFSER
jgi:hypothetical protein